MSEASNGSGMREHLMFLSRFLKSPRMVGAVVASSRALALSIVEGMDLDGPVRVVELGPGTGALTGAIVERLDEDGRLLAIDIDPEFIKQIRVRFPSVESVCASAERVAALVADRGLGPVDHIISGLPFASLPGPMTGRILEGVERALKSGGTFTTFQYFHTYPMPAAVAFRRDISARMRARPTRRVVWRNVPPALVLTWQKP